MNKIIITLLKDLPFFLTCWFVILLINQIFIFHACFKAYCLIAALPHTGLIAAAITFFRSEEKNGR